MLRGHAVNSSQFVNSVFREYYNNESDKITAPNMTEKREFGFISPDRVMVRHKAFANENELQGFLKNFSPLDAYYSCAYYNDPQADMDRKGWVGADLIFDIDADHITTSCDKVHDEWSCGACGISGKGIAPINCPACGKEKFETNAWSCEVCLGSAKKETVKLLEILQQDFGFSAKEIRVFFSGHRGYHVHVESESIQTLDAIARKEIVDYICGLGFDISPYGLNEKTWKGALSFSSSNLGNFGWCKRIKDGMRRFIQGANESALKEIGLEHKKIISVLLQNKDKILEKLEKGDNVAVKGIGLESWVKITEQIVTSQSAEIDTVVTTDIHRLIRMAGTLNSKTGFKKVEFSASAIDGFDPFKSSVAFRKGSVRILVSDAPEFRIGDDLFGPYRNQEIELPTAAAVFLICRGRAEVAEQKPTNSFER